MFVLVRHCTAVALARARKFKGPSLLGDLTNFMEVARRTRHCAFVETNIIKVFTTYAGGTGTQSRRALAVTNCISSACGP